MKSILFTKKNLAIPATDINMINLATSKLECDKPPCTNWAIKTLCIRIYAGVFVYI